VSVRKAIVLAAGLGTRLRPLTCVVPKPLLPVWEEPMLARIVALLHDWGVTDIVVNCHYLHEQVEAWCAANGCRASYEPEILGTGGVLNPLRDWIADEPFYLVNGDVVVEGCKAFAALEEAGNDVIGRCLVTETGPRTIEVEPESGFVTNWKSDDAGYDGTFTYCGIAVLRPDILKYVEPSGFSTIVQAYERAMMDGRFVQAVAPKDMLWTDAGTIASYVDLNRDGEDNAFGALPQLQGLDKISFLGARGSDRVFFRCEKGVAIVYDDAKRGENARYAGHAKWLAAKGVPVPEVIEDRPDLKTLVLSWSGDERKMTLEEDVKVVEALVKFNALGAAVDLPELESPFDASLYAWERGLFEEHCLRTRFHREMPPKVREELENVAALLAREPKALVHRDFQSTNVLWQNGEPTFIDFQGMRLGPAAYDLASFVYDPYVSFTAGERRALVKLYAKESGRGEIVKITPFAAVERLIQCLGAYGRLASVGQPQFGRWVLPALENLLVVADEAGLDAVGALSEDLIANERKPHEHEHEHTCSCGHHHHHD